jgi:hypothetical protein
MTTFALVILDCGLDRILGKHRAVNLHRWQCQFLGYIRVLDLTGFVKRFAFDPFGQQRA